MSPPVQTTLPPPPTGSHPLNIVELFALIDMGLTSAITETIPPYMPYILQSAEPTAPGDQGKAWIKLSSQGIPLGIYVYYVPATPPNATGSWRRVYNGMLGEIRIYSGNPATDFDVNPNGSWGAGKIGMEYDGWHLCNGVDGTPNLTDKFIVGAHMDNSDDAQGHHHNGYGANGWQTFVDGKSDLTTGGVAETLITPVYLPPLDSTNGTSAQQITGNEYKATPETPHADAVFLIDTHYGNSLSHTITVATYGADDPTGTSANKQIPFPTLPPFIALGYITFIGYA